MSSISLIALSTIKCVLTQILVADLTNCETTQVVRNYYDPSKYITICTECQTDSVLSYDMQTCILYSTLNNNSLQYCKRLNRDGNCLEYLCSIQINEIGKPTSITNGFNDENCSRIEQSTGRCIYPRLSFELDIDNQTLTKNVRTYCAIKQKGECIEIHEPFLKASQEYSVFIPRFSNLNKVDLKLSNINKIICQNGFELANNILDPKNIFELSISKKLYGCRTINYKIDGCINYDFLSRKCNQCDKGLSLNIDQKECAQISNCLKHKIYFDQYICLECVPTYYLKYGICDTIKNCQIFYDDSYEFCAACIAPFKGEKCQSIMQNIYEQCELLDVDGKCIKCKQNESYYFNFQNQNCQNRSFSRHCLDKSFMSDSCNSFDCEDGYVFDVSSFNYRQQRFNINQSCESIFQDVKKKENIEKYYPSIVQNYIQKSTFLLFTKLVDVFNFEGYYYNYYGYYYYSWTEWCKKRQTNIAHCSVIDKCFDSCSVCEEGSHPKITNEQNSNQQYKVVCEIEKPIIIEHCIEYDQNHQKCLQCEDYYSNSDNNTCQFGKIKNCRVYDSSNNCVQCDQNYILLQNTCQYLENCIKYDLIEGNVFCTQCQEKPDIYFSLVRTSQYRQNCVQNLANDFCSEYLYEKCVSCQRDFVFVEDTNECIREIDIIINCYKAQLINQQFQCISCITGYSLINNKCVQINGSCKLRYQCKDSNCKVNCEGAFIDNKQTCKYSCPVNQGFQWNTCVTCDKLYGEDCLKCNQSLKCKLCQDGFIYSQRYQTCRYKCPNGTLSESFSQCNQCKAKDCQTCIYPEECSSCNDNLILFEGNCLKECPVGTMLSLQNNQQANSKQRCIACSDNCISCTYLNNLQQICQQCQEGYTLESNMCLKCPSYLITNECPKKLCQKFVQDKICVDQCSDYYMIMYYNYSTIQQKICVDKCEYYTYEDNNQECTEKCKVGYHQNEQTKKCQKCQNQNCLSCINSPYICDKCSSPYFLQNNICSQVCTGSLDLIDPTKENCNNNCEVLGCKHNSCGKDNCYTCQQDFMQVKYNCICQEELGFYIEYPSSCKKCEIENCLSCLKSDYCKKCKEGYHQLFESGTDSIKGYWERASCLKECPKGYFLNVDGTCQSCSGNCKTCSNLQNCFECDNRYTLTYQEFYNTNNGLQKQIICSFLCTDGTKVEEPSNCPCLEQNCRQCNTKKQCEICNDGYQLINNKCEFISITPIENCILYDQVQKICVKCVAGKILVNLRCREMCPSGQLLDENTKVCPVPTLCEVNNCQACVYGQPRYCQICKELYMRDIFGNCVQDCKKETTDNQQICQPCPYVCDTCDKNGNCLTCKGTNMIENNCLCPSGYKLYKNKCVKKCPFYSTQMNDTICIEHCQDGLHPYYTVNREQRICEKVENEKSTFCIQNIENIPELVSFYLEKQSLHYILKNRFEQTPSICYNLVLLGKNENPFQVELFSENFDETFYQTIIPLDFIEKKLFDCAEQQCTGFLQISFLEEIQYRIKITLKFEFNLIITNGVSFYGQYSSSTGVCSTCTIPQSLTVSSNISVSCPKNSICSDSGISTLTNSEIQITQQITDAKFLNNKIQPHSLRLVYINKGVEDTLFIKNYNYINTIYGQITYIFKAIALTNANLVVTSICESANSGDNKGRLLITVNSDSNVIYPQFIIPFTSAEEQLDSANSEIEKKHEESTTPTENDQNLIIIIVPIVIGVIGIVIISIIIYKCKKNQIQRRYLESNVNPQQQIDNNSQLKLNQNKDVSDIKDETQIFQKPHVIRTFKQISINEDIEKQKQ